MWSSEYSSDSSAHSPRRATSPRSTSPPSSRTTAVALQKPPTKPAVRLAAAQEQDLESGYTWSSASVMVCYALGESAHIPAADPVSFRR